MTPKVLVALAVTMTMVLLAALGPAGFVLGLVTALVPVPLYILMALWLDRNEPEPGALLARAFLWGMLVASLFSVTMNAAATAYVQITLGLGAVVGHRVASLLASPIFEEISKGIALFLIFRRNRDEFDDVVDGAVYAAMVGLGFAATENVLYYGNAALHGRLALVFGIRGVASPFAHPLFTAMTGIGFGLARDAASMRTRRFRIGAGLLAAITLHFLWNAAAALRVLPIAYVVIMVPTFLAVLFLLRRSFARERDMMRNRMLMECGSAGITVGDVDALCATPRGLPKPLRRAGRNARRAATELAFACWHAECAASRGDADERIRQLRIHYLQACAEWRQHHDHHRVRNGP